MPRVLGSGFEFTVSGAIFFADAAALSSASAHLFLQRAGQLHGSIVGTSGFSPSAEFFAMARA
jgi:hypothetical protein